MFVGNLLSTVITCQISRQLHVIAYTPNGHNTKTERLLDVQNTHTHSEHMLDVYWTFKRILNE